MCRPVYAGVTTVSYVRSASRCSRGAPALGREEKRSPDLHARRAELERAPRSSAPSTIPPAATTGTADVDRRKQLRERHESHPRTSRGTCRDARPPPRPARRRRRRPTPRAPRASSAVVAVPEHRDAAFVNGFDVDEPEREAEARRAAPRARPASESSRCTAARTGSRRTAQSRRAHAPRGSPRAARPADSAAPAIVPSAPAFDTAAASDGGCTFAIGAWTIGYRAPKTLTPGRACSRARAR